MFKFGKSRATKAAEINSAPVRSSAPASPAADPVSAIEIATHPAAPVVPASLPPSTAPVTHPLRDAPKPQKSLSQAFGEIVAVLMRASPQKQMPLSDLEWKILPPVAYGQFVVAEAQSIGQAAFAPLAFLTWASVSPEIDRQLSNEVGTAIPLARDEWRSGAQPWVIDAVGDPRLITTMVDQLRNREWRGRSVKFRSRGDDGTAIVRELPAAMGALQPTSA